VQACGQRPFRQRLEIDVAGQVGFAGMGQRRIELVHATACSVSPKPVTRWP
jgi:hypothetical protein